MNALKQALRQEARARRGNAARGAATDVARHGLQAFAASPDETVAGYIAIGSEIDPAALLSALATRGHALCLPFVEGPDLPLGFRAYRAGDPLVAGPHGTREPAAGAPAMRPQILLVPLLAFDRQGYRLGYGGGYYDRTLAALRRAGSLRAIGLAYAAQEVASVPHDEKDERLDLVVTEQGVISCAED